MDDQKQLDHSNNWISKRLAEIELIEQPKDKVDALLSLDVELLPTRSEILQKALSIATNDASVNKSDVLSTIAEHLTELDTDLLQQALAAAGNIDYKHIKADALSSIGFRLPKSQQQNVFQQALAALEISDASSPRKLGVLRLIANRLPKSAPDLFERALKITETFNYDSDKAEVIIAIATHFPKSESNLLKKIWDAAEKIQAEGAKAMALSAIATRLDHQQQEIFQQALDTLKLEGSENFKSKALISIVSRLPESANHILEQAIEIAETLNENGKTAVLEAIAARLPKSAYTLIQKVCDAAETIQSAKNKMIVLSIIATRLPNDQKQIIIQDALNFAQTNYFPDIETLCLIADHLSESQQQKVLQQVIENSNSPYPLCQSNNIKIIVAHLPESSSDLLQELLTIAQTINAPIYKAESLSVIAAHLPISQQRHISQQVLDALKKLDCIQGSAYETVEILNAIVARLPASLPTLLKQILEITEAFNSIKIKAHTLSAIAARLPDSTPNFLDQAHEFAKSICSPSDRAKALSLIAVRFPEVQKQEVLQASLVSAQAIQDEHKKVEILVEIINLLPKTALELFQQALNISEGIEDDKQKEILFTNILACLPKSAVDILQRITKAAERISSKESQAIILSEVAAYLPDAEKQKAVSKVTLAIKDIQNVKTILKITVRLPEPMQQSFFQKALEKAEKIYHKDDQAVAYSTIASYLPELQSQEVFINSLDITARASNSYQKANALCKIVAQLPSSSLGLFQRVLDVTETFDSNDYDIQDEKSKALRRIAVFLPETPSLFQRFLSITNSIYSPLKRGEILSAISTRLPESLFPTFLEIALQSYSLSTTLSSPSIRYTETFVQNFPHDQYSTALQIVQSLEKDLEKNKLLSALIPHLSEGLLPTALNLIRSDFTQDLYQAECLMNLLPYLPQEQLSETLEVSLQLFDDPQYLIGVLANLIPLLPSNHFQTILTLIEQGKITQPHDQAKILRTISKALANEKPDAALSKVDSTVINSVDTIQKSVTEYILERPSLIYKTFDLTRKLKNHQQSDFSYENSASQILCQLTQALRALSDIQRQEVFDTVLEFKDLGYQACVLSAFAADFPDSAAPFLEENLGDDYLALLKIKVRVAFSTAYENQKAIDIYKIIVITQLGRKDMILESRAL